MSNNYNRLKTLFKELTGEENEVSVQRGLCHFLGDPAKGVLLNQLVFWLGKGINKEGWIWKSYADIFNETAIKAKTCSRYYDEFERKGFFSRCQKLAMGRNVVHYKIDMDKLTESIRTFWASRKGQVVQVERDKMSDSITENTAKNTSINKTLSPLISTKEIDIGNRETTAVITNFTHALILAGYSEEVPTGLPSNFEPSLESRFWAVTNFPKLSVNLLTDKFRVYFEDKTGIIKTTSGWQNEWRKWVTNENPSYNYDDEKLLAEQESVRSEVRNLVHLFALEYEHSVLPRTAFYSYFCDGQLNFSNETIDLCLNDLIRSRRMANVFGDYLHTPRKRRGIDGKYYDQDGQLFSGWNFVNESLIEFIRSDGPVTRSLLERKFPDYERESLDAYLDSGVSGEGLAKNGEGYWHADEFSGWRCPVGWVPDYEGLLVA